MRVCVCVCVTAGYLVGSNERVHCQVVLHHFLRHVWWVGQHSALEQSGGPSLTRLARRTGGLDVTEECVPRLEHRGQTDQASWTWTKSNLCRLLTARLEGDSTVEGWMGTSHRWLSHLHTRGIECWASPIPVRQLLTSWDSQCISILQMRIKNQLFLQFNTFKGSLDDSKTSNENRS